MKDEEIVRLYLQRDENALTITANQYRDYCTSIAYGILRDHREAEEIVNDALLKLWNTIPPEKPNPLKGFLGRITRQLSINRYEYAAAKKRGGGAYQVAMEELEQCLGDGECSDNWEDMMGLREAMNGFLRTLPDRTRSIFLQRYWYFCTVKEIAREHAIGEGAVKMLLLRTRNKMKEYLQQEGFSV